jgi:chemotaxis protein histidine kinase CheA
LATENGSPELRKLFSSQVRKMADDLAAFADSLRDNPEEPDSPEDIYAIAHSLHGAGTMYGFPWVSEFGGSLEKVVEALRSGNLEPCAELAELMDSCSAALVAAAECKSAADPAADRLSQLAWRCERTAHDGPPAGEQSSPTG